MKITSAVPLALALTVVSAPALAFAECNHPYFPAKTGTTWTYQDSEGAQNVMTVKGVEGDNVTMEAKVVKAAADAEEGKKKKKKKGDDTPTEVTIVGECTAEGVRMGMGGLQVKGAEVKMISHSGYSLAPAAKLTAGSTWTEESKSGMSTEGAPVQMTMSNKTVHKVVGIEKVKVAAGEFDAVKIEGDMETQMTMEGPMAGMMPKQPPQKGKTTTWLAKGVGVVKTEVNMTDAKGKPLLRTSELVSYSIGK